MPHLSYISDPCHWLNLVRDLGYGMLFDSSSRSASLSFTEAQGGASSSSARYDIISAAPECVTIARGSLTHIYHPDSESCDSSQMPVFDILEQQLASITCESHTDLPFTGGLAGFWGYELNHRLEPGRISPRETRLLCLDKSQDQSQETLPDMIVGLYLWAIITDHHKQSCELYFHPALSETKKQRILNALRWMPVEKRPAQQTTFELQENFAPFTSREGYDDAFGRIQEWIDSGDCYQVNLTQRFTTSYKGDPFDAYHQLRKISPTPFSVYLDFPQMKILSHSPERLLLSDHGLIESKPIKGTRPRGETPAQDKAYASELLASPKDRAENLMIVDLLRNDLGRNCTPGSIRVPTLFGLESYANVHHMVSTVTGELAQGRSNVDLLRDAFPGGSVTGAPKIRAMEIIRELEPSPRSVYCGAIGYISTNGRMDTNIPIRTLVADGNNIHTWGGGAIVKDSVCDSEYEESVTKVQNLIRALETLFFERQINQPELY